jgi:hypothetical protein
MYLCRRSKSMTELATHEPWIFITPEYPPDHGGVADYVRHLITSLNDFSVSTIVIRPGYDDSATDGVRSVPRGFGYKSIRLLNAIIPSESKISLQYVPQGFGLVGMNIPFCLWMLWRKFRHRDFISVMFHEVAYPFGWFPFKHNILAIFQRLMALILILSASQIQVSTSAWIPRLRRLGVRSKNIVSIPIPSNIPACKKDEVGLADTRQLFESRLDCSIYVGHFGTYGKWIVGQINPLFRYLLDNCPPVGIVLLGRGAKEYRNAWVKNYPNDQGRMFAADALEPTELAEHIAACDLMVQPYPDGANTRRTSLMACLINRVATVSNDGHNTESIWRETEAIELATLNSQEDFCRRVRNLIDDPALRKRFANTGYETYNRFFVIEHALGFFKISLNNS